MEYMESMMNNRLEASMSEYEQMAYRIAKLEADLAEARKFESSLRDIQSLLTDDKFASMFQSLVQYRTTIFETIGAAIAAIKEQGK